VLVPVQTAMAELMESLYTKTGNDRFDAAFHRLVAPPSDVVGSSG
jgi:hypothetical protein